MLIMRSSSLASRALFGAVGLGVALVAVLGCRLEVKTQTQFEDSSQTPKTSTKDWNGEGITISNDGINPLSGLGGVEVKISNTATKITAEAVFAARADDDQKADADASIRDAIQTMVINETANGFDIRCGHGGAHGTSTVAGSGCKILRVTIPAGSATKRTIPAPSLSPDTVAPSTGIAATTMVNSMPADLCTCFSRKSGRDCMSMNDFRVG
jgi:hypothetical protein